MPGRADPGRPHGVKAVRSASAALALLDEATYLGRRLAVGLAERLLDPAQVFLRPRRQRGVVEREELERAGEADVGDGRSVAVADEAVSNEVGAEHVERLGECLLGRLARDRLEVVR